MQIMIDLETLGTDPVTAPIIQIGVVAFRLEDDGPACEGSGPFFQRAVRAASNLRPPFNRVIDPNTVAWWADTDPKLLVRLLRDTDGDSLREVLGELGLWIIGLGDDVKGVWGNGATFDISMLEMAYKQADLLTPWHFRTVRDVRTMAMIAGDDDRCWKGGTVTAIEATGRKHDALVDCLRQVRMVQQTWQLKIIHEAAHVDA